MTKAKRENSDEIMAPTAETMAQMIGVVIGYLFIFLAAGRYSKMANELASWLSNESLNE